MAIEVFENEFDLRKILASHDYVVVDFFSTECPPCEKLAPIYERLSCEFPMINFIKVFRQGNRPLALELGVSGSPTVLFFAHGAIREERLAGDIAEATLRKVLEEMLAQDGVQATVPVVPDKMLKTDLCIIGTGPAGMTASIYSSRYKLDHLLVGELTGGLMTSTHKICNFPSETEISGMELSEKMMAAVRAQGGKQIVDSVTVVKKLAEGFEVCTAGGMHIMARTILLATGTKHRHLGLPNEEELTGRGVSYCATCDAMFYRNKVVAVVGGGASANKAALYLADVATKVYQIYRGTELKGEVAWALLVKSNPKIELLLETEIRELVGTEKLEGLKLETKAGVKSDLTVDGVFVEIGSDPDLTLVKQLGIETDEQNYIKTDAGQKTSLPGVWAAGDITTNSDYFRQIITACSEGAVASQSIFKYLQQQR